MHNNETKNNLKTMNDQTQQQTKNTHEQQHKQNINNI